MSIGQSVVADDRAFVLAQFKAGRSKAEIARMLGCDKSRVAKLLAQAIKESSSER